MISWKKLSLVSFWLIIMASTWGLLYTGTLTHLDNKLSELIGEHLQYSIESVWFGDDSGRTNDKDLIVYAGNEANVALDRLFSQTWYAAIIPSAVSIQSIDGLNINDIGTKTLNINGFDVPYVGGFELTDRKTAVDNADFSRFFSLKFKINGIGRKVEAVYGYKISWAVFVFVSCLITAPFALIHIVLPPPLTAIQRRWLKFLMRQAGEEKQIDNVVRALTDQQLTLDDHQRKVFDILYKRQAHKFAEAITVAADPRLKHLDQRKMAWFLWSIGHANLESGGFSVAINEAWALAFAPDRVAIDLHARELIVRSIKITVPSTPLFYYAWYASKRLDDGDSWVVNPQSNKPDKQQGRQLAEFMWQNSGHAKAISDLETVGLKAKTMDQNRSKLKDELVAVLGDALADYYLFEGKKDLSLGRMRYRIKLLPKQIQLLNYNPAITRPLPQKPARGAAISSSPADYRIDNTELTTMN